MLKPAQIREMRASLKQYVRACQGSDGADDLAEALNSAIDAIDELADEAGRPNPSKSKVTVADRAKETAA